MKCFILPPEEETGRLHRLPVAPTRAENSSSPETRQRRGMQPTVARTRATSLAVHQSAHEMSQNPIPDSRAPAHLSTLPAYVKGGSA